MRLIAISCVAACLFTVACGGKPKVTLTDQTITAEGAVQIVEAADHYQERTYYSASQQGDLAYLLRFPGSRSPQGFVIYMHSANAPVAQGMHSTVWDGTFARLIALLREKGFIYVCASAINLEAEGGRNLNELASTLQKLYGKHPVFFAAVSGGAQAVMYALAEADTPASGAVLISPAVDARTYAALAGRLADVPVWMIHAKADNKIAFDDIRAMGADMMKRGRRAWLQPAEGDRETPPAVISWQQALDFMEGR